MAEAVNLPEVLADVRRRWKIAALVLVGMVAGAYFYAHSLPNQYRARAVVAFAPKPTSTVGGDTLRVVLPKYVAFATAESTIRRVENATNLADLGSSVSASIAPDSGNLDLTVEMTSPSRASRVANAMSAEVISFAATDPLFDAVVVAPALPSSTPAGPPRNLIVAAAGAVGLLLGVILAFVLERGRPRIRNARDVSTVTGLRVVGRIAPSRSLRAGPVEALGDPEIGASIRTLRTNLERVTRDRPVHVLVVTSSISGEGKTTVASSLAAALARLDADVLLIDGDLRRPAVGRLFGMTTVEKGLSQVLRGEVELAAAITQSSIRNLHVLPTSADREAGDLLARGLDTVISEARAGFDVVVVDAPPLLAGDDARTVATMCDAVMLVVSSETLTATVSEAANALDALGVRVVGAVGNRMRETHGQGPYGSYD